MQKGIKRPPPAPYTINLAIDFLLKEEFDLYREKGSAHYLIKKYNIDAIPYKCPQIKEWRHVFTGIRFHHKPTDFLVYGAVDDIWVNPGGELIVIDYKATGANQYKIYDSYKRQMEIYQWLLSKNNFKVAKTAYFLFAKVNKTGGFASGKLSFDLFLEPLEGDASWVEEAIINARKNIDATIPEQNVACVYCQFVRGAK